MSRFVRRDLTGRITGTFAKLQSGYAEEEVADDVAELIAFETSGLQKTAAEINATKQEIVDDMQTSGLKALAVALFETINDVRVLKGQATITAVQYRAYLKSLI